LGKQLGSHHVVNFSERTPVLIDFISNALTKIKQVERDAKNSILSLSIIAMGIARAVCSYDRELPAQLNAACNQTYLRLYIMQNR